MAPEMMAIGDSLFNGMRSLTIDEQLARWSAPAQVAKALGAPFVTPDYPRNVVVNLEQWLREFPNVIAAVIDVAHNIKFWSAVPKSSHAAFDNIAIASMSYADLYTRTWKTAQAEIDALHGRLEDLSKIGAELAKLQFAFNTRFVLNPAGDPQAPALTPLEMVAERKPSRLLVNIGGNNGLWQMSFLGEASSGQPGGEPSAPFNRQDVADLMELVDRLKALPQEVKHIYLNALPLPSQAANLMPLPDVSDDPSAKPGRGGYYARYENQFGFDYNVLWGAQLAANDAVVKAVNDLVAAAAAGDPRLHLVRIDEAFARYDYKADETAQTFVTSDGKLLSDLMLRGPGFLDAIAWRGGLTSLDGIHSTLVGYAVMAREILAEIARHEGIAVAAMPDLEQAYQADTLLQRVPVSWGMVLDLALNVRRAIGPRPHGPRYDAAVALLQAAQFKHD